MSTEIVEVDDATMGSSFDDYLLTQGMHDTVNASAEKQVIVMELEAAMEAEGVSKAELARRMATSPSAVTRLLDPEETAVTLKTLQKAATALRRVIHLRLSAPAEASEETATEAPRRRKAGGRTKSAAPARMSATVEEMA